MAKGIIFDMDGVLIDSEPCYAQLVVDMFAEHGHQIPKKICLSQVGTPYRQAVSVFLQYWPGISEEEFTDIFQKYRLAFDIKNREILFPGVRELMRECQKRGMKVAIASGSTPQIIDKMVLDCDLDQLVDLVLSGENIKKNKPAPDIYLIAASQLGLRPEDCIAVEDSTVGIQAAKAAGMLTFAKRHADIALDQRQADYIIDDLMEIVAYL